MAPTKHQHHASIRLPLSLSIIYGSFTLGFYVAIQGPTLLDLIDILHVNNDIMSHTLALSSLAYSLGGLLSGMIFDYIDRQKLIPAYYVIFGVANIVTPYITNYYIYSFITIFKMMCAGGTDCGANVWILDLWPGKDAWLQALHFSFAVGCALGPLVVEPFLSSGEHKEFEGGLNFKDGHAVISENTESRIYVPFGVSGSLCILAAALIMYYYFLERKLKRQMEDEAAAALGGGPPLAIAGSPLKRQQVEGASASEQIPLTAVTSSHATTAIAIEAPSSSSSSSSSLPLSQNQLDGKSGEGGGGVHAVTINVPETIPEEVPLQAAVQLEEDGRDSCRGPEKRQTSQNELALQAMELKATQSNQIVEFQQQQQQQHLQPQTQQLQLKQSSDVKAMKFSSRAKERTAGRPPYYVMFAITLAAMCLSFYCGIEITSMNYLATFAVNIDLQLPKSTAALMSSALTISFAVGRLFGIWIAAYMRPHKLFYLCSAVMATGNVFILLSANTAEMFLWCSICLFGIGCGPMYASIVSFYDVKIAKVTNTVSGIFILGSMFNVALNTVIIGHYIIDNALILIVCNLFCAALLLCIFGSLHLLTKIKMHQRKRKFLVQQTKKVNSVEHPAAAAAVVAAT